MKLHQIQFDYYHDPDVDNEIEEYESESYCIDIDDLYYDLWLEAVIERNLVFMEIPWDENGLQLSEQELAQIKDILSVVSQVLTPMQVVALYSYSNYDAEFTNCPVKRKDFILKEMAESKNLNDYCIEDFYEFCQSLNKLEPTVFLKLTNIIYRSEIIRHLVTKKDIALEEFERYMNSLTWQST